jgi:CO dehydrogenase maturation factor
MTYTVAITGKGGVGKTTLAGLLISRLIARGCKPVLAVDADPNTCLDAVLGVRAHASIGGIREQARQIAGKGLAAGASKQEWLELKIAECLVEADDFDLLAMGRPEGPGCYCYANNVLKQAIQTIAGSYAYVVIDNEAGLENLSRRIVTRVDLLILVADPSQRGLQTLRRLYDLAREMDVQYNHLAIVINRLRRPDLPQPLDDIRRHTRANYLLALPDDSDLAAIDEAGCPLLNLPPENELVRRVDAFLDEIALPRPPGATA